MLHDLGVIEEIVSALRKILLCNRLPYHLRDERARGATTIAKLSSGVMLLRTSSWAFLLIPAWGMTQATEWRHVALDTDTRGFTPYF
jgi:hypothetical protein